MSLPLNTAPSAVDVIAEYAVKSTDFGGIQPALPTIAAGGTGTCAITVSRQFKPDLIIKSGQSKSRIEVSLPDGVADPTGVKLVSAVLTGPAAGSYAAGNRPVVTLTWANTDAVSHSPAAQTYKLLQTEIA